MAIRKITTTGCIVAVGMLSACGANSSALLAHGTPNILPPFIKGEIRVQAYDGNTDDLLTAGLGASGLAGAAPMFANQASPTAAELRKFAIWTNYRALVDINSKGGYGTLYGPNVASDGTVTTGDGKIPGREYIAYSDYGSSRRNVVLMVQVPNSFNPGKPCVVTATSSGSRGIYGAIGTAGEWGLKRGCAVAYTDKGTGNGFHDLMSNKVTLIDGTTADAATAGMAAHFKAMISDAARTAFNAAFPNRMAYKHAHSQQNPEKDWGRNTLQAIEFAFYVLNEQFAGASGAAGTPKRRIFDPANTIVIASSVSNGGGAALAAAEQDFRGLIDAVVVSEPNVQPKPGGTLTIKRGATTVATFGKPLLDYFTYANIYQPCAALAVPGSPGAPLLSAGNAANRCAALAAKGLVSGATTAEQAANALAKLYVYGWEPETDVLQLSHYRFATTAIAYTYSNAYGRFSVTDNLCGLSLAATDAAGNVVPQNPLSQVGLFSTGNGVPPTTGINIVYNDSAGGAKQDFLSTSPSTGLVDFALDAALCQRALATGKDPVSGTALTGTALTNSLRVRHGIGEVQLDGNLRNKPVIIVSGRADTLLPLNHASRPYYAKAKASGGGAKVRYIEVENGNHFDAFIDNPLLPGYDTRLIPMHHYFIQALDRMWAHLTAGATLPESQVVRTTPRGGTPGAAPAITSANVPPIAVTPVAANAITFANNTLTIPD